MKSFESLASFATDDRIIRLVAKERGKYTAKSNGKGEAFKSDPLFQALKGMTPPHKLWSDPGRWMLPRKEDRGIAKWTGRKRRASVRVYRAIRKWYDRMPDAPWVLKLDEFIADVRADLSGQTPLRMETPRVIPKFKEQDPESGDFIFRPVCQYRDLKTKIILALAYQYFVSHFDRYFHKNMLFMRGGAARGGRSICGPEVSGCHRHGLELSAGTGPEADFRGGVRHPEVLRHLQP